MLSDASHEHQVSTIIQTRRLMNSARWTILCRVCAAEVLDTTATLALCKNPDLVVEVGVISHIMYSGGRPENHSDPQPPTMAGPSNSPVRSREVPDPVSEDDSGSLPIPSQTRGHWRTEGLLSPAAVLTSSPIPEATYFSTTSPGVTPMPMPKSTFEHLEETDSDAEKDEYYVR